MLLKVDWWWIQSFYLVLGVIIVLLLGKKMCNFYCKRCLQACHMRICWFTENKRFKTLSGLEYYLCMTWIMPIISLVGINGEYRLCVLCLIGFVWIHVSNRVIYLLLWSFWRILFLQADCVCFFNVDVKWTCFKIAPFKSSYSSEVFLNHPFLYYW